MLFQNKVAPVLQLFSLAGNVSLITGSARDIGLAAAIGLAEAGSDVAITYNTSKSHYIEGIGKLFSELGVKFKDYLCNVSNKEEISECVKEVVLDFKRLDIVVPNAGIAIHGQTEDFKEEHYRNIMDVNLAGAFFTAQAAARLKT